MPPKKRQQVSAFAESKTRYAAPRVRRTWRERIARGERPLPDPLTLPDGTVRYFLKLGPKGRVLFPADLRTGLGVKEGDVLVGMLKDGELRLESQARALDRIQQEGRRLRGNRSVVDELIAER